jgi:hypothetical protein
MPAIAVSRPTDTSIATGGLGDSVVTGGLGTFDTALPIGYSYENPHSQEFPIADVHNDVVAVAFDSPIGTGLWVGINPQLAKTRGTNDGWTFTKVVDSADLPAAYDFTLVFTKTGNLCLIYEVPGSEGGYVGKIRRNERMGDPAAWGAEEDFAYQVSCKKIIRAHGTVYRLRYVSILYDGLTVAREPRMDRLLTSDGLVWTDEWKLWDQNLIGADEWKLLPNSDALTGWYTGNLFCVLYENAFSGAVSRISRSGDPKNWYLGETPGGIGIDFIHDCAIVESNQLFMTGVNPSTSDIAVFRNRDLFIPAGTPNYGGRYADVYHNPPYPLLTSSVMVAIHDVPVILNVSAGPVIKTICSLDGGDNWLGP